MAVLGLYASGMLAVVENAPTINGATNTLVVVLVALLGSGFVTTLIVSVRDRRIGSARVREMEEHAADLAVNKFETALRQSERDLDKASARIDFLESQISTLTLRIVQLESELGAANTDRAALRIHLQATQLERETLSTQLSDLEKKVGGRREGDQ